MVCLGSVSVGCCGIAYLLSGFWWWMLGPCLRLYLIEFCFGLVGSVVGLISGFCFC